MIYAYNDIHDVLGKKNVMNLVWISAAFCKSVKIYNNIIVNASVTTKSLRDIWRLFQLQSSEFSSWEERNPKTCLRFPLDGRAFTAYLHINISIRRISIFVILFSSNDLPPSKAPTKWFKYLSITIHLIHCGTKNRKKYKMQYLLHWIMISRWPNKHIHWYLPLSIIITIWIRLHKSYKL